MATRRISPRANGEGGLGRNTNRWGEGWFDKFASVKAQTLTLAGSATAWDLQTHQSAIATLDEDIILNNISNQENNLPAVLTLTQGSSAGEYTVSFNASYFDLHDEDPEMPITYGSNIILSFISDGSKMHLTGWWAED